MHTEQRKQVVSSAPSITALPVRRCRTDERGISVGEGNDRDVDIAGLEDGLVVGQRVSDDQQARLHEALRGLIGEGTRGVAASDVLSAGVLETQTQRDNA